MAVKMMTLIIPLMTISVLARSDPHKIYKPDWSDLDSRPIPEWYEDAKVGIFIHWGVFSVPGYGSEWFWYYWQGSKSQDYINFMTKNYAPDFSYQNFAEDFTAKFFNATQWADLFKKSGAKYVVLTSKHHEGFTLWPSKRSFSWNSVDTGPRRDIVLELSKAVKTSGLRFGLYHSLFEWFNPMYLDDERNGFTTRTFATLKAWPDLKQLVNDYEPSIVWSDGDQGASDDYWGSKDILAWLYNTSPVRDEVVVNDRWGNETMCTHGGYYTCSDRYNPGTLQPHKWENCFTLDKKSWGYRRNAVLADFLTIQDILKQVVSTVSCRGNVLINIGPTKDGIIEPIFEERLLQLGEWLDINGEAIYSTSPWVKQNDTLNGNVWYTVHKSSANDVFAMFLVWPENNQLLLNDVTPFLNESSELSLLGNPELELKWHKSRETITISLPDLANVKGKYAWTVKFKL